MDKKLVKKNIELDFLKEKLLHDITYLKIFSNENHNELEKNVIKLLSNSTDMAREIQLHLYTTIKKMSDMEYFITNIHTKKDLNKNLQEFLRQGEIIEENLKNLNIESQKVNNELNLLKKELLKDIHQKINGSFLLNMYNFIFKKKAILF